MSRVAVLSEHPGYVISDTGRIQGPRGKWLKQMFTPTGYLVIRRWSGERYLTLRVHVLVCTAFHGDRPLPTHQVRHLNGIKTDNRAENLRWGTPKENQRDRVDHGTSPQGEGNGQAKLTAGEVKEIRALYTTGCLSKAALARQYAVGYSQVTRIVNGESWRCVA